MYTVTSGFSICNDTEIKPCLHQ